MAAYTGLISWPLEVASGATLLDLVVGTDVAGDETLTLATGTYDGFATDGSGNPTSTTIADAFCDLLATHTDIDTCSASYVYSGAGFPRTTYTPVFLNSATTVTLKWTDVSTELVSTDWGFDSADTAPAATVTTTFNTPGYWAPGALGVANFDDQRWTEQVAFRSRSPLQTSASYVTRRWGEIKRRVLRYDAVADDYVRLYRASDSDWATRSGRDTDDPNNLLENLVDAASRGVTLTLWLGDADSVDLQWAEGQPFSAQSLVQDWGDGGSGWWVVDLPVEEP